MVEIPYEGPRFSQPKKMFGWLVARIAELEAENNKWLRLAQEFERENETLRELLIERDGGTHDADCKVHNPGIKRCNCGHAEVVELRSRLALDELLEERQEMESLATGNSLD